MPIVLTTLSLLAWQAAAPIKLWPLVLAYCIAHQVQTTATLYFVFGVMAGSLPTPDSTSGKFYQWFYKVTNSFAANLDRAAHQVRDPATAPVPYQPIRNTNTPNRPDSSSTVVGPK